MPLAKQFLRNLQRFRLVTFDVTDTLLHLKDPIEQYKQTANECGVQIIDTGKLELCFRRQFKNMSKDHPNFGQGPGKMGWQCWWKDLVVQTFRCVDGSIPQEQLDTIAEHLLAIFRTRACWEHVNGAKELVERVRNAGKCVGVISNFDPSLRQVLDEMNFMNQFDFVLTSYEAGVMKPNPSIFRIPLQRLNIAPHEALHIGNKSDMDYMGARNSGWSGLLVHSAGVKDDSEVDEGQHTYKSIAHMLNALETQEIQW
ncbi:rhythmically expressed gene 2 protein [Drosophila tropicalis]|uniref:rhythmically expressed gene 2 protein n=1 Tax=Drosophila tropicalis TaxID=46794 RepID=UPI0035ABFF2F